MVNHRQVGTTSKGSGAAAAVATSAAAAADYPLGAHLVTPRLGYSHHGIYVGNGKVVHYAGLSRTLLRGPVEEVTLEHFAGGRPIIVKDQPRARFSGAQIVARARLRLGENAYRLATNNCEHFCEWCIAGEGRSEQVERLVHWPRSVALALGRVIDELFSPGWQPAPARR